MISELQYARLKPYDHQVEGVTALVDNPFFALFDEMGVGKTKQVIDAAQTLAVRGQVNRVIVVSPAAVRSVWYDIRYGEIKEHHWNNLSQDVIEYHGKKTDHWTYEPDGEPLAKVQWVITNYAYIRRPERLKRLLDACHHRTLLVLDESSAVKNWKSQQTRACAELRARVPRVVLLNGTPIDHSPADLFSQGQIMSKTILKCANWWAFRARYAVIGGFGRMAGKLIVNWQNLEDLNERFKPYVLRREKKDCLDLPEKLPPVTIEVPLTPDTWRRYIDLRDEMITWLTDEDMVMTKHVITKIMRLAQITSGFVGGIEKGDPEDAPPDFLPGLPTPLDDLEVDPETRVAEISDEKLHWFLTWMDLQLQKELKMVVWGRFRPELFRLYKRSVERYPDVEIGILIGGQKKSERQRAKDLLHPRTSPDKPVIVIGHPATGGVGLNFTAAHQMLYLSHEYSLKTRLQSMDRVHRPGQTKPVSYYDVVATGPRGERTIDHLVLDSQRRKFDVANLTTTGWVKELTRE